jgi:hypothetical protein
VIDWYCSPGVTEQPVKALVNKKRQNSRGKLTLARLKA